MADPMTSKQYEIRDPTQAFEFYYERGWTDGLPVVPATEARVRQFLEAAHKEPSDIIGVVPTRGRVITAEKAAINAVMAGCCPEYMPVVIAIIEAVCDEAFNLHGSTASTQGSAQYIVVNGPIAKALGMNCADSLFGPGNRANATIGRAIRLVLMNVCGAIPGVLDRSTHGHGGKYTFCIAENEEASPLWKPLHVERGFRAEDSVVTVMAALAPRQVTNHFSNTAEGILDSMADAISNLASGFESFAVVIGPEHLGYIARQGWTKQEVRQYLFEKAGRSVADLKRTGWSRGEVEPGDEKRWRPAVASADQILVVAAGGAAGGFSQCIPPWAGGIASKPVSRRIAL